MRDSRGWVRQIMRMIRAVERNTPEAEADHRVRPLWVRRGERLLNRMHGRGPLAREGGSLAGTLGRQLGNRYGANAWLWEECRNGIPPTLRKAFADGFASLEVEA